MALKKGNIAMTTKAQKNKMNKLDSLVMDLDIEIKDEKVIATITMNSMLEPYVRNRMSGVFKKDESGQVKKSGGGHLYDPLNTYKKRIEKYLLELLQDKISNYKLCEGYILFDIEIHTVPPKSFTKRQTVFAFIKKLLRPITKPDLDNVVKTAMDICTGILWKDDNQVIELRARKFFAQEEKTIIKIEMDINEYKILGRANKEEEELWNTLQQN